MRSGAKVLEAETGAVCPQAPQIQKFSTCLNGLEHAGQRLGWSFMAASPDPYLYHSFAAQGHGDVLESAGFQVGVPGKHETEMQGGSP
jgi:hypothetical protein